MVWPILGIQDCLSQHILVLVGCGRFSGDIPSYLRSICQHYRVQAQRPCVGVGCGSGMRCHVYWARGIVEGCQTKIWARDCEASINPGTSLTSGAHPKRWVACDGGGDRFLNIVMIMSSLQHN